MINCVLDYRSTNRKDYDRIGGFCDDDGDVMPAESMVSALLGDGCICRLSADATDGPFSRPAAAACPSDTLAYLSVIRLLLSTGRLVHWRRQPTDACNSHSCATAERARSELISDVTWSDYLLDVLSSVDAYVRYAAVCVASETVLSGAANMESRTRLVDGLFRKVTTTALDRVRYGSTYAAALDVFTRILDAKDKDPEIDLLLLDRLDRGWLDIVDAVVGDDVDDSGDVNASAAAAALVRLWKSVFTSCGHHPDQFYSHYYSRLSDLHLRLLYRTDGDPHLWLDAVRLFNIALGRRASGPTMAVVAQQITTGVTRRRLLYFMGKMAGGRTKFVQETVLLAMQSLRVSAADGDASAVTDVIDCLDSYVKSSAMYATDVRFCQWPVRLLSDRDDAVVEWLMCAMDVADAVPDIRPLLNPFDSFSEFLACVGFEPEVLLDFLISDENDFLPYALRILKMACQDTEFFFRSCSDRLEDTMALLIRLRLKILRLQGKNVFPYNIGPIVKLIQRCDEAYSEIVLS